VIVRVLVIDLNNFSRYPTLPVGQLVAVMRSQGVNVDVLSPLARGVKGYPRLTRAKPWGIFEDRLRYWSAVTPSKNVRRIRSAAARLVRPGGSGDREAILDYTEEMLRKKPDVVLISAYTMYYETCAEVARLCKARNVPVIVGGNYFVDRDIVERWLSIDGVAAVYGGEPERDLVSILRDLIDARDISKYRGVSVASKIVPPAPPLERLDDLPFPDYSDFPWHLYPNRIVPIMTGRGCGWGNCRFCADVVTSAGRTFRSRSLQHVIDEIKVQRERHKADLFVFLDLKLNSDLELWRGLIDALPVVAPNAAWTTSVHVDTRADHGLFIQDLAKAKASGLARITTGLETGSPKLLKSMAKGTDVARSSEFIRSAAGVGISVRLTTMIGYPGEQPEDVESTTEFLYENEPGIERVMLNRFSLMAGTPLDHRTQKKTSDYPLLSRGALDPTSAIVEHENLMNSTKAHRRAVNRLLGAVHRINRKPLNAQAQEFEGVM